MQSESFLWCFRNIHRMLSNTNKKRKKIRCDRIEFNMFVEHSVALNCIILWLVKNAFLKKNKLKHHAWDASSSKALRTEYFKSGVWKLSVILFFHHSVINFSCEYIYMLSIWRPSGWRNSKEFPLAFVRQPWMSAAVALSYVSHLSALWGVKMENLVKNVSMQLKRTTECT